LWEVWPHGLAAPEHPGTTLTPVATHDGTNITALGVTLDSGGNLFESPTVYRLGDSFLAGYLDKSTPAPQSLSIKKAVIRRKEADNGCVRGASCTLTLWGNQTLPQLNGNEVVEVKAGRYELDDGEWAPVSYTVFTGRVVNPERRLTDVLPEEDVTLELEDDAFLLSHLYCCDRVSSAEDTLFRDAWHQALTAFGIHEDRIKINGYTWAQIEADPNREKFRFKKQDPTPGGVQKAHNLTPKPSLSAQRWLDVLVRNRGDWIWRVEPDGTFHALPRPLYQAGDPLALTLRETPASDADAVCEVVYSRNLSEFVNRVLVVSEGAAPTDGQPDDKINREAIWQDDASISDPNDRYYVGGKFEELIHDNDLESAAREARRRGEIARSQFETLKFKMRQGQAIFCQAFIKSLLDLDELPTGTLLRVIEEERTLDFSGQEAKHEVVYLCGVDTIGAGTEAAE
jgi:hypothetical protein